MKLQLVERTTCRISSTVPKISVSTKGTFYVNTAAMQLIGVKKPEKVKIFQDATDARAWYLHICKDGYATLSPKSTKDGSGQVNMTDLAHKLINSYYHVGKNSLSFTLHDAVELEGLKYYPFKLIKESLEMEIPDPNSAITR